MSNAFAWLNKSKRPGLYAGRVAGAVIGVQADSQHPKNVTVLLSGKRSTSEACTEVESSQNPGQMNTQFSVHADEHSYVAYLGQKRNSPEYSIALYKRDELSDLELDTLFDAPAPDNSEAEADPPF